MEYDSGASIYRNIQNLFVIFQPPMEVRSIWENAIEIFKTPGLTRGVLSTRFTVYDNGYPHDAFLFGGADLDFTGMEQTELYINSVRRLMQLEGIEVNIQHHPESGDVFERYEILQNRSDGDSHPFVDPEDWTAWLDLLLFSAQAKTG